MQNCFPIITDSFSQVPSNRETAVKNRPSKLLKVVILTKMLKVKQFFCLFVCLRIEKRVLLVTGSKFN